MRNALKYFYNIDVDDINNKNGIYYFDKYVLKEYKNNIDIDLYNYLFNSDLRINKIVLNKENNFITNIDNKQYVLIENIYNDEYTIDNILREPLLNIYEVKDWSKLWEDKVDYFEKVIITIMDKNIRDVYPYYIGLSECAIRIYKEKKKEVPISLCHKRIGSKYRYNDPDNIVIDYKVRDIAEYIKYLFFEKEIQPLEIINLVDKLELYGDDALLLYARLLFPTYFYDCLEDACNYNIYTSKINSYELFLKDVFLVLNKSNNIPAIDWIQKKI